MESTTENTLNKQERLNGDKRIDFLFSKGEAFISYPLRIVYIKRERSETPDVCMMVSVSKKRFKRAVKRNRMKRLMRETFRLNKQNFQFFCKQENIALDIAFLYLKNEFTDFHEINKAMEKALSLLQSKLIKKEEQKNA